MLFILEPEGDHAARQQLRNIRRLWPSRRRFCLHWLRLPWQTTPLWTAEQKRALVWFFRF